MVDDNEWEEKKKKTYLYEKQISINKNYKTLGNMDLTFIKYMGWLGLYEFYF